MLSRTVSELSQLTVQILHTVFLSPLWGSSSAHWKARNRLPISVNWTFFARCYGWGATSKK